MSAPASRLDSLTGLRAILALMVLLYHGWARCDFLPRDLWISGIVGEMGKCGVAAFFVLSGYILAQVYSDRNWSSREFFANRVARIYPLYLIALIFTLPLDWLSSGLPSEGRAEALGLSVVLQQSWFPFANGRFNSPGWTVSVEVLFYILFPLLFLVWKKWPSSFKFVALGTGLLTAVLWNPESFYLSQRFPLMRVWEFILGMALAMIPLRKVFVTSEALALLPVLAAPLAASLLDRFGPPFSKWFAIALLAGVSILLLAARDTKQGTKSLLATKWLVIGGEISYGLYLLHDGVQRYARVGFEKVFDVTLKEAAFTIKTGFLLSTSVASVLLAWICWKLVEMPARSFLRKKLAPHGSI